MITNNSADNRITPKVIILFCLIFAGEMIFSLPFHVARFFRPTFLSTFGLTNAQLGDVFAFYGVMAMLSYFPGGLIADRISGRRLMAASLFFTALGGVYLAQIPGLAGLRILFGYWGITTILLFWAAMIKVTRDVGGDDLQGRAFGFLDGGRGLVAAAVASLAVFVLGQFLPDDLTTLSSAGRTLAIQKVIYFYAGGTMLAALMVWFLIPSTRTDTKVAMDRGAVAKARGGGGFLLVLKQQRFWWIALIVVCAYCGFKGVDNYALYATQVLGMDELQAAKFTSYIAYTRPLVAIIAGFLADRFMATRVAMLSFALMLASYSVLGITSPVSMAIWLLIANLLVSVCGVYAVRAVYFALLHEGGIPKRYTGTAVGIVSVIGFTPDIFFAPIAGRILDAAPGLPGHQNYFLLMAAIACVGMIAAWLLVRRVKYRSQSMRSD